MEKHRVCPRNPAEPGGRWNTAHFQRHGRVTTRSWGPGLRGQAGRPPPPKMHLYSPLPLRTARVLQALSTRWHPGPYQSPSCPRACSVHGRAEVQEPGPPPISCVPGREGRRHGGFLLVWGLLISARSAEGQTGFSLGSLPAGAVSREAALSPAGACLDESREEMPPPGARPGSAPDAPRDAVWGWL